MTTNETNQAAAAGMEAIETAANQFANQSRAVLGADVGDKNANMLIAVGVEAFREGYLRGFKAQIVLTPPDAPANPPATGQTA